MKRSGGINRGRAFTLIEALAVVALVATVLPVAMYGISMATNAAGRVSQRDVAARIAADKLTEMIVTNQAEAGDADGDIQDSSMVYHWAFHTQPWMAPVAGNMFSGASQNTVQSNQTGGANQANQTNQTNQNNLANLVELDVQVTWQTPGGQRSITTSTLYYEGTEDLLP